ncbi:unnamed protein product [Cuscuta europaea]|uniref:Uncharacterized protein n=1 Tax=Cuscuta europaea TaxID=41803 RepID=A0A9P1EHG1_CUSEU|nr:unnamed protein product [Cuscuta europaea]
MEAVLRGSFVPQRMEGTFLLHLYGGEFVSRAPSRQFLAHSKVGSAALEKSAKKISAKLEGPEDVVTIDDATLPNDLYSLGFRRYRLFGESDEKYPMIDRVYESVEGATMDVQSFVALKRQKGKAQAKKRKEPTAQKPVDVFFRKEGEDPSEAAPAGDGARGSQADAAKKKKKPVKGHEPSAKKQKVDESGKQPASDDVIVVDDVAGSVPTPPEFVNEDFFGWEKLEAFVPKGISVFMATLCPSVFMSQVMPSGDRVALAQTDDDALNSRTLLNSASTYMGLCEHLRRDEQLRKTKLVADEENSGLRKKMADLEETLQTAMEGVDQRLEAAKAEGRAEGKTEAEKVAREAA